MADSRRALAMAAVLAITACRAPQPALAPDPPLFAPAVAVRHPYPDPARIPLGAWARWRERRTGPQGEQLREREWVRLPTPGGVDRDADVWVEELVVAQGTQEVTWRRVSPDGTVVEAWRGLPGQVGVRLELRGSPVPERLAGAVDTAFVEPVDAGGVSRECRVLALPDGGRAWTSDQVPFDGLVRLRREAPGETLEIELIDAGTGRGAWRLTR